MNRLQPKKSSFVGVFTTSTRLQPQHSSVLAQERSYIENLWSEAQEQFMRLYESSVESVSRANEPRRTLAFAARAALEPTAEFTIAEFMRTHLAIRSLQMNAARVLEDVAEAAMAAIKRICNTVLEAYHVSGDPVALRKSPRLAEKVDTRDFETASWMVTQNCDRNTYHVALGAVRRLQPLVETDAAMTPLQKKEAVSSALSPLLAELSARERMTSVAA